MDLCCILYVLCDILHATYKGSIILCYIMTSIKKALNTECCHDSMFSQDSKSLISLNPRGCYILILKHNVTKETSENQLSFCLFKIITFYNKKSS